jgi:nucleoside 2-deoxyribosyltransferase
MTAIYIAGSWLEKQQYRDLRAKLDTMEIGVTSRWLDMEEWDGTPNTWPAEARRRAEMDLEDIDEADVLVCDTRHPSSAGGYHFEMGYAHAWNKPIIIVGTQTNIFQHLIETVVPSWEEAVNFLISVR